MLARMPASPLERTVLPLASDIAPPLPQGRHARQLVNHGHFLVNGKKVDIPSYTVEVDDVITVRQNSREMEHFKALREGGFNIVPKWLTLSADELKATVAALPAREDIDFPLQENMIVEFYSR